MHSELQDERTIWKEGKRKENIAFNFLENFILKRYFAILTGWYRADGEEEGEKAGCEIERKLRIESFREERRAAGKENCRGK
jgi:hypothetical protein